jgi:DUF2927 family protein
MRSFFQQAVRALCCCALAGCAGTAARDAPPDAGLLVSHFEAVAFTDQYDPGRDVGRVRKWTGPIRIALHGAEAPRFGAVIRRYAAELAGLTRLSIDVLAAPDSRANFDIRFVAWDDMEKEAQAFAPRPDWLGIIVDGAACLFIIRRNDRYEIVRALVLVSTREADDDKARCLLEEMTQALGLPNDSDRLQPSIFNSFDRLAALTPADRIMLRTLYDPRMVPGQPREEALGLARRIIGELLGRGPN